MVIDDRTRNGSTIDPLNGKGQEKESGVKRANTVTEWARVSDKDASVSEAEKAQRLKEIEVRIRTGFYSQPQVTEKVVEALVRELSSSPGERPR